MYHETSLIIIDMQIGVFDGLVIRPVFNAETLLSKVSQLIVKARNKGIPIIFVHHKGEKGHPLEFNTPGWSLHPDIRVNDEDIIIYKYTPDAFYNTDLQNRLNKINTKKLIIAGIQTEYCIDTTCRCAFGLDYQVTLVKDAHSTWDTDQLNASQIINHHNFLLNEWFVEIKQVSELDF